MCKLLILHPARNAKRGRTAPAGHNLGTRSRMKPLGFRLDAAKDSPPRETFHLLQRLPLATLFLPAMSVFLRPCCCAHAPKMIRVSLAHFCAKEPCHEN